MHAFDESGEHIGPVHQESYRERSCEGKIPHRSKHSAKLEKKRLKRMAGKPLRDLVVYKCVFCRKFHLGHENYPLRSFLDIGELEIAV